MSSHPFIHLNNNRYTCANILKNFISLQRQTYCIPFTIEFTNKYCAKSYRHCDRILISANWRPTAVIHTTHSHLMFTHTHINIWWKICLSSCLLSQWMCNETIYGMLPHIHRTSNCRNGSISTNCHKFCNSKRKLLFHLMGNILISTLLPTQMRSF